MLHPGHANGSRPEQNPGPPAALPETPPNEPPGGHGGNPGCNCRESRCAGRPQALSAGSIQRHPGHPPLNDPRQPAQTPASFQNRAFWRRPRESYRAMAQCGSEPLGKAERAAPEPAGRNRLKTRFPQSGRALAGCRPERCRFPTRLPDEAARTNCSAADISHPRGNSGRNLWGKFIWR